MKYYLMRARARIVVHINPDLLMLYDHIEVQSTKRCYLELPHGFGYTMAGGQVHSGSMKAWIADNVGD